MPSTREKYYRDFRDHLKTLEERGKLVRIRREINKDTELMPLVRWQFRGLDEAERKAFIFENVVDGKGRRFDMPVTVGTLAATTEIYAIGMMCEPDEIAERWTQAQMRPVNPVTVAAGPAQEVIRRGDDLLTGKGLDMIPVPISTPGFDNAPYLTSANWITKDPDTGIYNIGNYRSQIKAADRCGGFFMSQHMGQHWRKSKAKGKPLEAAIAIGVSPNIAYAATAKIPYDFDEYRLAGGLAGAPVELVQAKSIDLLVPATAEIVIEGIIPTDSIEPEGPFGEYPGYMGHRSVSPFLQVSCITHREGAIYTALMSQFPPSESSKIKHTGTEKIIYKFLRHDSGNAAVVDVALHDEVSGSGQNYCVIKMRNASKGDAWRALNASAGFTGSYAKICVAVDDDIDIRDPAMVNWAICFNVRPDEDVAIAKGKSPGLDPSSHPPGMESLQARMTSISALLINAVRPWPYTPVSLPKKEFMERSKRIWEELELPPLKPRMPWYGYSLGAWSEEDEEEAALAVQSEYFTTGKKQTGQRRKP
ncbi:MAG TPA: UbiD family decarboxylase [Candidatus Binatia bacterium]|nr:UbiD family decarboxylase [Candidatus Binatia bacterium]